MMPFLLQMQYCSQTCRPAVAWFVPGSCAQDWLAEICGWGLPLSQVRLHPVPRSTTTREPLGVLVTVTGPAVPRVSPRAVPYGQLAGRLYLPVAARLSPPVAERELEQRLGSELVAVVWHPVSGLIGFEAEDRLSVTDLLSWPPACPADWSRAQPGMTCNTRLRSVAPEQSLNIDEFLQAGGDDIGTQTDDLGRVPPVPGESPLAPLKHLGSKALSATARVALGLLAGGAGFLGSTSGNTPASGHAAGSGGAWGEWVLAIGNWLEQLAQSAQERAQHASQQATELRRLLHLLATDPDQGLKFAPPLAGRDAGRGVAPPSGKLSERQVDFSLSQLSGGGAADCWYVPFEIQQRLQHEYRRLAERELHLGRYRRAAYVFANLLGDIAAAAGVLATGRYFREAAVLYRDRLHQPREAARCLEQAGDWTEALALYEQLHEYLYAGDLARRLELADEAERLYRLEITRRIESQNYSGAAAVLDEKLHAVDEALQVLETGWLSRLTQRQCLHDTFQLLGREGRHADATRWIARCHEPPLNVALGAPAIMELTAVARSYPDQSLRILAADMIRVLVAERLRVTEPRHRQSLVDAVTGLVPEDRLLARDGRRYIEHVQRPPARPARLSGSRVPQAELVRELKLPGFVNWRVARGTDTWCSAAGFSHRTLVLVQLDWTQQLAPQRTFWNLDRSPDDAVILLEPDPHELHPLYVQLAGRPALAEQILAPAHNGRREILAGTPPWATPETLALDRAGQAAWTVSRSHGGLALAGYNLRHHPLTSRLIEIPEDLVPFALTGPVHLKVRDRAVYIGLADHLIVAYEQGHNEVVELYTGATGLACSLPFSRRRVAVALETGARLFWDDNYQEYTTVADTLSAPLLDFTRTGFLIAAGTNECEVYNTAGQQAKLAARCGWEAGTPIGVMRTGRQQEFAIALTDGRILVYQHP